MLHCRQHIASRKAFIEPRWKYQMNHVKSFFTTDFCPGFNKYVYWMKKPLGWYALASLAALLIALYYTYVAWFIFVGCLVVIGISLAWPWLQIRLCHCELVFDKRRSHENEEVIVKLVVKNRGPIPLWGLAIQRGFFTSLNVDPGDEENEQDEIAVTLSQVPPFSSNVYKWKFTPNRRGVYPVEKPVISTGFPFGIWSASKQVELTGQTIIWPSIQTIHGFPSDSAMGAAAVGSFDDRAGDQGDLLGSRIWHPGESLRMVNWSQSAKCEEDLIVLERQALAKRHVQILIDFAAGHDQRVRESIVEWQIRIVASLVNFFHGHQFAVCTNLLGDTQQIGTSNVALHGWLDKVAKLDVDESTQFAFPKRDGFAQSYLVTTDNNLVSKTGRITAGIPIILNTTESNGANQLPQNAIEIDFDASKYTPLQQLAIKWSACHRNMEAA